MASKSSRKNDQLDHKDERFEEFSSSPAPTQWKLFIQRNFLDKKDRKRNFPRVRMIQLIKRCLFWKMRALSAAIERPEFAGEMGIEFKLFLPAAFATSVVKLRN